MGFLGGMSQILTPPLNEVKLLTVAGGFYGFISVNISVWLHSCFSEWVTETLTVKGPPPMDLGGNQGPYMHLPTITRHELTRLANTWPT